MQCPKQRGNAHLGTTNESDGEREQEDRGHDHVHGALRAAPLRRQQGAVSLPSPVSRLVSLFSGLSADVNIHVHKEFLTRDFSAFDGNEGLTPRLPHIKGRSDSLTDFQLGNLPPSRRKLQYLTYPLPGELTFSLSFLSSY